MALMLFTVVFIVFFNKHSMLTLIGALTTPTHVHKYRKQYSKISLPFVIRARNQLYGKWFEQCYGVHL